MSPEGLFHAAAGATGIITGIVAVATLKGGSTHRAAGKIFVAAMVIAALSAVYLAFKMETTAFVGAAVLIIYFMLTAWMAVKRREHESGWFEIIAFLVAASGATAMYYAWSQALGDPDALLGGLPLLVFAIVATLCALGDLSVILRRGLAGRQRILRHLWRMHLGFFAAVGSFFPGQLQMFPEYIQNIRPLVVLFIPPFSIAALMLFWLAYVILSGKFASRGAKA